MNQLAYPHTVRDIVLEYQKKQSEMTEAIEAAGQAIITLNSACEVAAGQYEPVAKPLYISRRNAERVLLSSAWRAIYKTLNLDNVFSANDKKNFEQSLSSPAPLTLENLQSTFGRYWENPRYYILKGLAEVFCSLDKFYKSHSNFGFGVKGLPKRAILGKFSGYGSWGFERLNDMCAAMEQAKPGLWLGDHAPNADCPPWREVIRGHSYSFGQSQPFTLEQFGLEIRTFANGNAHVYFNPRALNLINDCLHEFYGTVLPDDHEKPDAKQAGTGVSKDLAFYRTPPAAVDALIAPLVERRERDMTILEPSCGDGAILDVMARHGFTRIAGVEVHPGRAAECRAKGHTVFVGNFLEYRSEGENDWVLMNPPFSGMHYLKHIAHAIEQLATGGTVRAILPATAWYSHGKLPSGGTWRDLPIGSFRESGTNVNTGIWEYKKS